MPHGGKWSKTIPQSEELRRTIPFNSSSKKLRTAQPWASNYMIVAGWWWLWLLDIPKSPIINRKTTITATLFAKHVTSSMQAFCSKLFGLNRNNNDWTKGEGLFFQNTHAPMQVVTVSFAVAYNLAVRRSFSLIVDCA